MESPNAAPKSKIAITVRSPTQRIFNFNNGFFDGLSLSLARSLGWGLGMSKWIGSDVDEVRVWRIRTANGRPRSLWDEHHGYNSTKNAERNIESHWTRVGLPRIIESAEIGNVFVNIISHALDAGIIAVIAIGHTNVTGIGFVIWRVVEKQVTDRRLLRGSI